METKRYWTDIVEKANQMRKWLDEKPDEYKIGYQCSTGGILNAFREGDLNFDEARAELDRLINVSDEKMVEPLVNKTLAEVECNKCEWFGNKKDLIIADEELLICPNCGSSSIYEI